METIIAFKYPARRHFEIYNVIALPNCSTQKNLCFLTIAATHWRHKIQNGSAQKFNSDNLSCLLLELNVLHCPVIFVT